MQFHTEKKHVIDCLFPIALFFVFAASSFIVIIFAANIYSSTTASAEKNYEQRTALSYVTEKIRQADADGAIRVGTFDGHDSLIIEQQYESGPCYTYIYEDQGNLKELFIQAGVDATASAGSTIMPVSGFTMEETQPGLFTFTCTADDGEPASVCVSTQSKGGIDHDF